MCVCFVIKSCYNSVSINNEEKEIDDENKNKVQCPHCTSFNEITAVICEVNDKIYIIILDSHTQKFIFKC